MTSSATTQEKVVDAGKLAAKLSPSQRDGLVAVLFKTMSYSGPSTYWPQGSFSQMRGLMASHTAREDCPKLTNDSRTGHSLLSRKLVETGEFDVSRRAPVTLSDLGSALVEQILTPVQRAALVTEAAACASLAEREQKQRKEEAWRQSHAVELEELRLAGHERGSAIHAHEGRISQIASLLGNGANNVDELLAELRAETQKLNALVAERKDAWARSTALTTPPDD